MALAAADASGPRDSARTGCPMAFLQGLMDSERPPRRVGWRAHPNPPRCHTGHRKRGVAPTTASGSGAAQPPRRSWYNHNPDNDIRSRRHARPIRGFAHIGVRFTCAALARHRTPVPSPTNRLPRRSCAPGSFRSPIMLLNRSDRDEPDLLDDLPLPPVKHPPHRRTFLRADRAVHHPEESNDGTHETKPALVRCR